MVVGPKPRCQGALSRQKPAFTENSRITERAASGPTACLSSVLSDTRGSWSLGGRDTSRRGPCQRGLAPGQLRTRSGGVRTAIRSCPVDGGPTVRLACSPSLCLKCRCFIAVAAPRRRLASKGRKRPRALARRPPVAPAPRGCVRRTGVAPPPGTFDRRGQTPLGAPCPTPGSPPGW